MVPPRAPSLTVAHGLAAVGLPGGKAALRPRCRRAGRKSPSRRWSPRSPGDAPTGRGLVGRRTREAAPGARGHEERRDREADQGRHRSCDEERSRASYGDRPGRGRRLSREVAQRRSTISASCRSGRSRHGSETQARRVVCKSVARSLRSRTAELAGWDAARGPRHAFAPGRSVQPRPDRASLALS